MDELSPSFMVIYLNTSSNVDLELRCRIYWVNPSRRSNCPRRELEITPNHEYCPLRMTTHDKVETIQNEGLSFLITPNQGNSRFRQTTNGGGARFTEFLISGRSLIGLH